MPCAIHELGNSCRGPPTCRKCTAQAALGAHATKTPPGLCAKIKAACDTDTASRIV